MNWYGAIAQLGERLHGMQEVSGSIPLGSTNFPTKLNRSVRPGPQGPTVSFFRPINLPQDVPNWSPLWPPVKSP